MKMQFISMCFVLLAGSAAWGQGMAPTADVKSEQILTKETKIEGWRPTLSLGATASLNDNRRVVGTVDGTTVQLGLLLAGALGYAKDQHDWQNNLDANLGYTRTPQLDRFVKSADALKFRSLYVFRLQDWVGPFIQFKLDTQMFPGYDVKTDAVTVRREFLDGTNKVRTRAAQSNIPLTEPFEPLLLSEAVGLFARPVAQSDLTLDVKLGAGAQQIFARDGFTVADDKATPELELKQLDSTNQLGAAGELSSSGKFSETVVWTAYANFFFPFYSSVDLAKLNLDGVDRLNSDIGGKISAKLSKWASLDYVVSFKRIPLILDAWQIQTGLLFTAGFNVL